MIELNISLNNLINLLKSDVGSQVLEYLTPKEVIRLSMTNTNLIKNQNFWYNMYIFPDFKNSIFVRSILKYKYDHKQVFNEIYNPNNSIDQVIGEQLYELISVINQENVELCKDLAIKYIDQNWDMRESWNFVIWILGYEEEYEKIVQVIDFIQLIELESMFEPNA
jgi:hypothetical protein